MTPADKLAEAAEAMCSAPSRQYICVCTRPSANDCGYCVLRSAIAAYEAEKTREAKGKLVYDGFVTLDSSGGLRRFGSWPDEIHGAWVAVTIRYEPKP